jgi:hypothetical protein
MAVSIIAVVVLPTKTVTTRSRRLYRGRSISVETVRAREATLMDGETEQRTSDLVYRLRERARIRRSIDNRKSVQLHEPDRIADLLEEAAAEIVYLREGYSNWQAHEGL